MLFLWVLQGKSICGSFPCVPYVVVCFWLVIDGALDSDPEKFPVVVSPKSISSNASRQSPDVKVGVPVIEEEVDFPFFEEEIEEGKFVP
jgi:hypothetical protein